MVFFALYWLVTCCLGGVPVVGKECRHALQLSGKMRTFRSCVPDILNFVAADKELDVFVLTNKDSDNGYHEAWESDEHDLKSMLASKMVDFAYLEDMDPLYSATADLLEDRETLLVQDAALRYPNISFVHGANTVKQWYSRFLNNRMRRRHERRANVSYCWVFQSRMDICYPHNDATKPSFWNVTGTQHLNPSNVSTLYLMNDIFFGGDAAAVDFASNFIWSWPYAYLQKKKTGHFPPGFNESDAELMRLWLFMSEMNLNMYLNASSEQSDFRYKILLPHPLTITRADDDRHRRHIRHGF